MAGPEFGYEKVNVVLVARALYVQKFSGAYFRALLSKQFCDWGYRPSIDDPGFFMRPPV